MERITILFAENDHEFPLRKWRELFELVPKKLQGHIESFKNSEDRQASLLGKLLLKKWAEINAYNGNILEKLVIDQNGKPGISPVINFSISHSKGVVVCAISHSGPIGIDIEKLTPIDIDDFKGNFSSCELEKLSKEASPTKFFFETWTKKEAVLKAVGIGIVNNLNQLDTLSNPIVWNGKAWHICGIPVSDSYCCHIATVNKDICYQLDKISFL